MTSGVDIETLRSRHRELEQEIDDEARRPLPDSMRIAELKRLKLRIKDDIARLSRS
ncbi:MAG: DUF465 domain-containing protein [Alphaproteobacteria bacterium]|nr:DUF465 domain-containing protein [Alphaproteobacteria bacterium]